MEAKRKRQPLRGVIKAGGARAVPAAEIEAEREHAKRWPAAHDPVGLDVDTPAPTNTEAPDGC